MIVVNWYGFIDGYKGSGILEYKYKVMDSSGSIIIFWILVGNLINIIYNGLILSNSIKYFVIVKVIDVVGLSVDVILDGFNVDIIYLVFIGKIIVIGKDDVFNGIFCVYILSILLVRVKWLGFFDVYSGFKSYFWVIVFLDSILMDFDFKIVLGFNLLMFVSFSGSVLI